MGSESPVIPAFDASALLEVLWARYTKITPVALVVHQLLRSRGEMPTNDHVALRTYAAAGIGKDDLGARFEKLGWVKQSEHYEFPDKHVTANYWLHANPDFPKIFISELDVAKLSQASQAIVGKLIASLSADILSRSDLPWAGRLWQCAHGDYETLAAESEYAGWVAAYGFEVNHFTVLVNSLTSVQSLQELNEVLIAAGITLLSQGGVIKGTPAQHLEQSSTVAERISVPFSDGAFEIPSCYYEFARRYEMAPGELFHGFVPTSANQLFHSTDRKHSVAKSQ